MKISIDDIIALFRKAMELNKNIHVSCFHYCLCVSNQDDWIEISKNDEEDKLYIETRRNCGRIVLDNLSSRDITKLELLRQDCILYREERAINDLSIFFDTVKDKPTNIDDLNDEE